MVKPITPAEACKDNPDDFPDEVIEAFNELIKASYSNGIAFVWQRHVKDLIMKKMGDDVVFKNWWLNVEPLYRKAGWNVKYDKPGHNEDYEASFEFRK